jgi:urease subunit alpha
MFGAYGGGPSQNSLLFVSGVSIENGMLESLKVGKSLSPVSGCRSVRKSDMVHNHWLPEIEVDPETYVVRANGEILTCEPMAVLPMAQRYSLF